MKYVECPECGTKNTGRSDDQIAYCEAQLYYWHGVILDDNGDLLHGDTNGCDEGNVEGIPPGAEQAWWVCNNTAQHPGGAYWWRAERHLVVFAPDRHVTLAGKIASAATVADLLRMAKETAK